MGCYIALLVVALILGLALAFCVFAAIIVYYKEHKKVEPSPIGYVVSFAAVFSAFAFPFLMLGITVLVNI